MPNSTDFEYGEEPIHLTKSVYCAKCMTEMTCVKKGEFHCVKCNEKYVEKE